MQTYVILTRHSPTQSRREHFPIGIKYFVVILLKLILPHLLKQFPFEFVSKAGRLYDRRDYLHTAIEM